MSELRDRLQRAIGNLEELYASPGVRESGRVRIGGKIEGLKLALSYLEEEERILGSVVAEVAVDLATVAAKHDAAARIAREGGDDA